MQITVTKHAKPRLKERAGIKGCSANRIAERAFEQGITREEATGDLYKYLTWLHCYHEEYMDLRLFNYKVYIFSSGGSLVTVEDLPREYKVAFEKTRARKKEQQAAGQAEMTKDEGGGSTMGELTIINRNGVLVTDSREVAEWVGKDHPHLLRDIKGYCEALATQQNPNVDSAQFFIPSTYQAEDGSRSYPCYLITKKGCDMVANKLTGEKGVRFTATYIDRFYEMEATLSHPGPRIMSPAELALLQAQTIVDIERKQNEQQAALEGVTKRLDTIGDIISLNPNDWRRECLSMLSKIAYSLGDIKHMQELQRDVYQLMDDRFGVRLNVRLTNMKRVAAENGMCKSRRDKLNYLDVIAEDKKLIEAYVIIVKELAIKHGVDKVA